MDINTSSGTSSTSSSLAGTNTSTTDLQNSTASTSKLGNILSKVSSSFVSGDTGEPKSLKEIGNSVEKEVQRSVGKVKKEAGKFLREF